ncbi:MAG: hypothetical protein HPY62_13910, partial [Bacteroidales bacterium]|nr:hypothetical protein [Bacteroidales bacterium]
MSSISLKSFGIQALLIFTSLGCLAQKIATFEVTLQKPSYGIEIPVSVNLDEVTWASDTLLNLVEVKGINRINIPFQIDQGNTRTLYWLVSGGVSQGEKHIYELVKERPATHDEITASFNDGALTLHKGSKNLLRYYYKTVYPPAGVD